MGRLMPGDTLLTDDHVTAWARLLRGSQHILHEIEDALKTAGLPPLSWYDLLLEVKRSGPEGLRPFELQNAMLIPQYNLSRMIDRVAKAGYVERVRCETDGRGQIIRITAEGKALQKRMWPVYRRILDRMIAAHLSADEADQLARLLQKLAAPSIKVVTPAAADIRNGSSTP
jgi:DNA-binding MarR family transcriptional regulator